MRKISINKKNGPGRSKSRRQPATQRDLHKKETRKMSKTSDKAENIRTEVTDANERLKSAIDQFEAKISAANTGGTAPTIPELTAIKDELKEVSKTLNALHLDR